MSMSSEEGSSTGNLGNLAHAAKLQEKFKIVSSQSSARPGAIIELVNLYTININFFVKSDLERIFVKF